MLGRILIGYHRRRQQLGRIGLLGSGTVVEPTARFEFHDRLRIGSDCRIGPDCFISAQGGVEVGDGTIFGPRVVVYSSTHQYDQDDLLPYGFHDEERPVVIGRGAWLGHGVCVAPGAVIGDAVVAGMGAVIAGTVPPGSIVAGNPARVIGERDSETVRRLIDAEAYYMQHKARGGGGRVLVARGVMGEER